MKSVIKEQNTVIPANAKITVCIPAKAAGAEMSRKSSSDIAKLRKEWKKNNEKE